MFFKSEDELLIIKFLKKDEFKMFDKNFASKYFKYMCKNNEETKIAKILGIYKIKNHQKRKSDNYIIVM
jgi:hypothetical protein